MRVPRSALALALGVAGASAFMPGMPLRRGPSSGVWGAVAAPRMTLFASTQEAELTTTIQKGANSTVNLIVTVPGSMTRKAYDDAMKRLLADPSVRVPGFRKGQKVPEQYVLNAIGGLQVLINEALDGLCEDALKKAIDQSGVKAVGQASLQSHPQQLISAYKPGEPLNMEVKVDVYPDVTFKGDYKGLKVTVERVPLEDKKVKVAIDALLKKRLKLLETPEGYKAQLGDSAIVNMNAFQMLSDGTRGPEMRNIAAGEGVEVVLETGRFLPGVVESLVGQTEGAKVVVPVTFPEQIRDPKLAGLKCEFDIEVLSVKKRVVPELNDEFAASIREGLTAEDIKKEVIDAVNADAEAVTKGNRDRALENAILQIVECEVPECWIVEETRRKFALMMQEMSTQGKTEEEVKNLVTKENFEKYREISLPGTLRTLQLGVAVAQIAEKENLSVDPVELQDQADLRRIEAERQGMDEKALKDQLEAKLLADMVMDLLASTADITYVDRAE